jgi:hypothetical protein
MPRRRYQVPGAQALTRAGMTRAPLGPLSCPHSGGDALGRRHDPPGPEGGGSPPGGARQGALRRLLAAVAGLMRAIAVARARR